MLIMNFRLTLRVKEAGTILLEESGAESGNREEGGGTDSGHGHGERIRVREKQQMRLDAMGELFWRREVSC